MTNKSIRQRVEEFSCFDMFNTIRKASDFNSVNYLRTKLYYREDFTVFWIDPLMFEL